MPVRGRTALSRIAVRSTWPLLPGGRRALTANHTADSVSLVDLRRGQGAGRSSRAAASRSRSPARRDGRRAAVSNLWSRHVHAAATSRTQALKAVGEVAVGALPRGLAFRAGRRALYVAVAGRTRSCELDWASRKVAQRWPAPREPRHLALSADGRWLAAASSRSAQVRCWDTADRQAAWERTIEDAFNLRGLAFTPDESGADLRPRRPPRVSRVAATTSRRAG